MTTLAETIISREDADQLNAARDLLEEIQQRCARCSYPAGDVDQFSLGKLHEAADQAESRIFDALNTAGSHGLSPQASDAIQDRLHAREVARRSAGD